VNTATKGITDPEQKASTASDAVTTFVDQNPMPTDPLIAAWKNGLNTAIQTAAKTANTPAGAEVAKRQAVDRYIAGHPYPDTK
jgi:hypothetical protein